MTWPCCSTWASHRSSILLPKLEAKSLRGLLKTQPAGLQPQSFLLGRFGVGPSRVLTGSQVILITLRFTALLACPVLGGSFHSCVHLTHVAPALLQTAYKAFHRLSVMGLQAGVGWGLDWALARCSGSRALSPPGLFTAHAASCGTRGLGLPWLTSFWKLKGKR